MSTDASTRSKTTLSCAVVDASFQRLRRRLPSALEPALHPASRHMAYLFPATPDLDACSHSRGVHHGSLCPSWRTVSCVHRTSPRNPEIPMMSARAGLSQGRATWRHGAHPAVGERPALRYTAVHERARSQASFGSSRATYPAGRRLADGFVPAHPARTRVQPKEHRREHT